MDHKLDWLRDDEMAGKFKRLANNGKILAFDHDANRIDLGDLLDRPHALSPKEATTVYRVVMPSIRPSPAIVDDHIQIAAGDVWRPRLRPKEALLVKAARGVGRVNDPSKADGWIGTCWRVGDDVVVTNRHVANSLQGIGAADGPSICFDDDPSADGASLAPITELVYLEPDDGPDIAFLRVDFSGLPAEPTVIVFGADPRADQRIAVIGYPGRPESGESMSDIQHIFGASLGIKRLSPGTVHGAPDSAEFNHNCSTLGGNSGSLVVDIATGRAVGLHYSAVPTGDNLAVLGSEVKSRVP